jgi:hypothetical protein
MSLRHPPVACLILSAAVSLAFPPAGADAQTGARGAVLGDRSVDWMISTAVLAAPAEYREGAEVRAWTDEGRLTTLREGSNDMICLADRPGDGRFRAACYHASLEPFMESGRALRRQGLEGMERQEARWAEIRAGRIEMPPAAMVYNLGLDTEDFDPDTLDPATGGRLHAIYMRGATAESTGLPTTPGDGPWLMFPGSPSAHVMISIPAKSDTSGGG